jgi:hypothetical protein
VPYALEMQDLCLAIDFIPHGMPTSLYNDILAGKPLPPEEDMIHAIEDLSFDLDEERLPKRGRGRGVRGRGKGGGRARGLARGSAAALEEGEGIYADPLQELAEEMLLDDDVGDADIIDFEAELEDMYDEAFQDAYLSMPPVPPPAEAPEIPPSVLAIEPSEPIGFEHSGLEEVAELDAHCDPGVAPSASSSVGGPGASSSGLGEGPTSKSYGAKTPHIPWEFTLTTADGKSLQGRFKYDTKLKKLAVHCGLHGRRCRTMRSTVAGVRNAHAGRPLGFLVAWIACGAEFDDAEQHMACSRPPDVYLFRE